MLKKRFEGESLLKKCFEGKACLRNVSKGKACLINLSGCPWPPLLPNRTPPVTPYHPLRGAYYAPPDGPKRRQERPQESSKSVPGAAFAATWGRPWAQETPRSEKRSREKKYARKYLTSPPKTRKTWQASLRSIQKSFEKTKHAQKSNTKTHIIYRSPYKNKIKPRKTHIKPYSPSPFFPFSKQYQKQYRRRLPRTRASTRERGRSLRNAGVQAAS